MDPLAQCHYEVVLEHTFMKSQGDEFQKFFGRAMNLAFPGDFTQIRPWGNLGDNKCDGYLPSKRRFFQCYGPTHVSKNKALEKLNSDFNGALQHAPKFFDSWVLAHNFMNGRVPFWLAEKLNALGKEHKPLQVEHFGLIELRSIVFGLSNSDLVGLLGPPPTQQAMISLGFEDLKPILDHLQQRAGEADDPHPVSGEKLAFNELSKGVETLLRAGMTKAKVLQSYFARTQNKELATRVAAAFRHKYAELKSEGRSSLEIFEQLRSFAGGPYRTTSEAEVSCLAIVAYLFESCDIFERPLT
jgi:hypothetical protein